MLLGGLGLQAVGSALGALADGAAFLLLTRTLEGLGFLAVLVASPTLVVAIAAPAIRDRAVALWATFMPVGLTLVMLGAPLLGLLGWRGFWLANAGLLAAYALFFAYMMRTEVSHDAPPRAVLDDLKAAIAAPGPWGLAAIFTAFSAMYFAVFSFLPLILDQRFGLGEELAGLLTAGVVAAGGVGNVACGLMLARGYRPSRLLAASFVTMAAGGFAILSQSSPFLLVSALAVGMSFMAGLIPVVLMDSVPRLAPRPELAGVTIGFATQGNSLGMLAGPALAAGLAAHAGWTSVAILLTVLAAAALVVTRLLFRPHRVLARPPNLDFEPSREEL